MNPQPGGPVSPARTLRVGIISLGCSKNLVDTEVMLGHLDRACCEFVQDPGEADVILVNTCGFIDSARAESVQAILEAAEFKKTGRLKRLVVAGCMVQRYRDQLFENLPEIDAFIDLDQLDRVAALVGAETPATPAPHRSGALHVIQPGPRRDSGPPTPPGPASVAAWSAATFLYDDTTPRRRATPAWTAYVKIAEGCDHTCSFCAIPSFRGKFRSRQPESIVREVERLAAQGVREINLIAQDSSHYGRDLGLRDGLAGLLESLDRVDGPRWLRVHYLYPNTITDRLVTAMASCSRVVDYVDLPLQHADPATLLRMRRGGSAESHLKLLDSFRRAMPEATLRSTLIVGFPGETEQEFENLLDFVEQARFNHLGVFTYSHEEGTLALQEADDVPAAVKEQRRGRLMELQQRLVFERNATLIGRREVVLLEGVHEETEHLLVGRMASQAPEVDGQVLINDGAARPGEFVLVELTETAGYDMVGRIVGPA